jgi:outer membrane autotransporter protein
MMGQGAFWLGGNPVDAAGVSFAPLEFAQNDPRGNANAATDASHAGSRPGRWRVWTLGFGSTSSLSGQSSSGSMTQTLQSAGGAFGIDHELAPDLLVGFAIGASNANFAAPSLATSGQSTGVHVGIYGSKTFGAIYLASALNYTHFDNSTTRVVSGIGTTETETGNFASHELGTRLELGWKHGLAGYTVTPFVAIEPSAQFQDGYTESSLTLNNTPGILGLTFASHTTISVPTFVGAQIDMRTRFDSGWTLEPFIRASWVHEFTPNRQVSASFVSVPTASFTVQGPAAPSDSARIDAGLTLGLNTKWSLYGNFTGEVSARSHGYAGTGGFRMSW